MSQPVVLFEPQVADIVLMKGSRYRMVIDVLCDFEPTFVNWTGAMMVRSNRSPSGNLLQDMTTLVTVDSGTSQVILDVPADTSSAYTWDTGEYDIEMHHPSDPHRNIRVLQGKITLNPEVTR